MACPTVQLISGPYTNAFIKSAIRTLASEPGTARICPSPVYRSEQARSSVKTQTKPAQLMLRVSHLERVAQISSDLPASGIPAAAGDACTRERR
jgi:hypothetical protein